MTNGMPQPSLSEVQQYWEKNPVHSVEFPIGENLREYLNSIDALRWSDNERWAESRFYDLALAPGAKILDAGCGIGVFTRYYARKGFQVEAVDISRSAVEMTRKSLELFGLPGMARQASVEDLPFSDSSFDFVVSNGVIHHTPNTEKAVSEIYRVLKPGGLASICVYYRNIFLRYPFWFGMKLLLPFLLRNSKGREGFFTAQTPEEFVKIYDGNETPITKLYSRAETDRLFGSFVVRCCEPHYFPVRFLRVGRVGSFMHRILDRSCGALIYYLLEK